MWKAPIEPTPRDGDVGAARGRPQHPGQVLVLGNCRPTWSRDGQSIRVIGLAGEDAPQDPAIRADGIRDAVVHGRELLPTVGEIRGDVNERDPVLLKQLVAMSFRGPPAFLPRTARGEEVLGGDGQSADGGPLQPIESALHANGRGLDSEQLRDLDGGGFVRRSGRGHRGPSQAGREKQGAEEQGAEEQEVFHGEVSSKQGALVSRTLAVSSPSSHSTRWVCVHCHREARVHFRI
jgi:hypothetical protein